MIMSGAPSDTVVSSTLSVRPEISEATVIQWQDVSVGLPGGTTHWQPGPAWGERPETQDGDSLAIEHPERLGKEPTSSPSRNRPRHGTRIARRSPKNGFGRSGLL